MARNRKRTKLTRSQIAHQKNMKFLKHLQGMTLKDKSDYFLQLLNRSFKLMTGINYMSIKTSNVEKKDDGASKKILSGSAAGFGYAGANNDPKLLEKMKAKEMANKESVENTVSDLQDFCKFMRTSLENSENETVNKAYDTVNNSCLNLVLSVFLRDCSMLDILPRKKQVLLVLEILEFVSERPALIPTLGIRKNRPYIAKEFENHVDLFVLVKELNKQAKLFILGKEEFGEIDEFAKTLADITSKIEGNVSKSLETFNENTKDLVKDVKVEEEEKKSAAVDVDGWLRSRKFDVVDLSKESFYYKKDLDAVKSNPDKKKMNRLRKEMAILSNSLPDGIFVRVHEDRFDMMKVMIIGPEDTPYENGCFLFDLFIPNNYPNVCPKMIYLTTGGGKCYINPNLYANGKICLSLLGTWSGPGWDPKTSTLLQLFVSIQAMVMVPYPYQNEPAYINAWNSDQSRAYSKGVRMANALYAMLWHFTKPACLCFDDIIKAHFYNKRDQIKQCIEKWDEKDSKVTNKCNYNDFTRKGILSEPHDQVKKKLFKFFSELSAPKI